MRHFFKWPLDNLIYIGQSEITLPHTFAVSSLTDENLEKINEWYTVAESKGNLIITDNSDILLWKKKKECREKIESEYKQHDQINTLLFGTDKEITIMKTFIGEALEEFRANKQHANFSKIK